LNWADLPVAGIGLDIAGAAIIAWTLGRNSAARIAAEIPIHGFSFGLPSLARTAATQRAEARLGIGFLVLGFIGQASAYFFPHSHATLRSWTERGVALVVVGVLWLLAAVAYRWYVPRSARRTYAAAATDAQSAIG
jgi:uncharacterized BrkB/YihY/UPF0761 family membrane protein